MKITKVETFLLKAPLGSEHFWSSQAAFPERSSLLVRLTTDDGLVGWGEGGQYGPGEPVRAAIESVLGPVLLAMPDASPAVVWERLYTHSRDFGQKGTYVEAISAIDIALWDLMGQELGAPVSTLIGGRFREKIRAYGTGGYYRFEEFDAARDLPSLRETVREYTGSGFTMLKLKVGLLPVSQDAARVHAVREELGDGFTLMVDANHAYNAASAISMGHALEEADVAFFEEPVPPEDLSGYQRVRAALRIPIAGGEAEFTRYGFRELIARECIDIAQPDVCVSGGITEVQRIAALTSAANLRLIPHVWGSGIALAAGLHVCAALPLAPHTHVPIPLQNEPVIEFDRTLNPLRDDLLLTPFGVDDEGCVAVPTAPGLGIDIDLDVLERYQVG